MSVALRSGLIPSADMLESMYKLYGEEAYGQYDKLGGTKSLEGTMVETMYSTLPLGANSAVGASVLSLGGLGEDDDVVLSEHSGILDEAVSIASTDPDLRRRRLERKRVRGSTNETGAYERQV